MRFAVVVLLTVFVFCSEKSWHSQDDFSSAYLGAKASVVRRQIGKPDRIVKKNGYEEWVYRAVITDTLSQATGGARLVIEKGLVKQVSF